MTPINGFAPLAAADARLLILGSMPSVASLDKQQYYGKPQNAFWKIMGDLFDAGPDRPYAERARQLLDCGIAVWDVIAQCKRAGSLDSAIDMQSVVVNDFAGFLADHTDIRQVFFNGRTAEKIWRRCVAADLPADWSALTCHGLPSTSPAMASLDYQAKLKQWRILQRALSGQLPDAVL